jgi:hypothetical protein
MNNRFGDPANKPGMPVTSVPLSPLEQATVDQLNSLSTLEKVLSELDSRLQDVLYPNGPVQVEEFSTTPPMAPTGKSIEAIRKNTFVIVHLRMVVASILERLQV